jgi:hypothetical protein
VLLSPIGGGDSNTYNSSRPTIKVVDWSSVYVLMKPVVRLILCVRPLVLLLMLGFAAAIFWLFVT